MSRRPSTLVVAVVDNDLGILRSLAYLLESANYTVRPFCSGLDLLHSGCLPEIDCLISDIDMQGMDGFELLRQVHTSRPGLPVIFITGHPETVKRQPASTVAGTRVFIKPFQGQELLAAVAESLRSSRG